MSWTRRAPTPPPKGTGSDWYWYWADGEKEPWSVEVYHGSWRLYTNQGYWWDEIILKPNEALPRKRKITALPPPKDVKREELQSALNSMPQTEETPRRYRGRGIL